MKYYEVIVSSGSFNSRELVLNPVDPDIIDYWDTAKVYLDEPVKVKAYNYHEDDRERDYVCAGNPQVVSEEFKNLVEELDSNAAQFFETVSINCVTKKKYFLMHVTQVINCLDREHSKIIPCNWLQRNESIAVGCVDISKIPEDCHMFRLGEDVAAHYVSEKFFKEYKKRKMRGCQFYLRTVKDSENSK